MESEEKKRKEYMALLTHEYQSHNELCSRIGISVSEREHFLRELKKWEDGIETIASEFGIPRFMVRLKKPDPLTHVIINTGDNYGNMVQSSSSSNIYQTQAIKEDHAPQKIGAKNKWNKWWWAAIVPLIIAIIAVLFEWYLSKKF